MTQVPWTHRGGKAHRYIRKTNRVHESWAACSCGWEETGARAGDKPWREGADKAAWEAHVKAAQS